MQPIRVTHFTDPGCPWAYSAAPALAALRWRYGDQLDWDLVTIGLTEEARQYADRGYTPRMMAGGYLSFRARWGMPFATAPKPRVAATSRACRAIVVARGQDPALGDAALRVLQLLQFTTPLPLDDDDALRLALQAVVGLDADATVGALDDDDVVAAYEADRGRARTAEGGPTHWQGKAANSDGRWRFTAPVARLRPRRGAPGGGRLPVAGGLRRPAGEPQPPPGAARPAGRRARGARRRAAGAHHRGGGRGAAPRQRRARPPRVGGGPRRRGRRGRSGAGGGRQRRPVARARATPRVRRAGSRRGPSPRSAAASRRSPPGRRPRRSVSRDRADVPSRAGRVVAARLELDGDVDDPAGVGDEVRRPQDPARAAGASATLSSASWLFAAPGDRRRLQARDRVVVEHAAERARARARRPAAVSARAGVDPARAELPARARAWPGRCRRPGACAPARAQQAGQAQADVPEPERRATLRPRSDADAEGPLARRARSPPRRRARCTGSGRPSRRRGAGRPVTWRRARARSSSCRAWRSPTSSAVT